MMRNKKRPQHFQGRAGGQKESSRNERDVGLKRETWVVLGAAAERSSRALLPLSTINQRETQTWDVLELREGSLFAHSALTWNAESKTSLQQRLPSFFLLILFLIPIYFLY